MNAPNLEKHYGKTEPLHLNRRVQRFETSRLHTLPGEIASSDALDWSVRAALEGEYQTSWSVEFSNDSDQEFARTLEARRILWKYKSRTFAVEWDEEGNFVDSFTPGFYLPAQNRYFEVAAPDCRVSVIARKIRLLRQQYSLIKIDLLFPADRHQSHEILSGT